MAGNAYWKNRQARLMYGRMDDAEVSARTVSRIYAKASADINQRMREIFQKYQDKWNLSEEDARMLIGRMPDYSLQSIRSAIHGMPDSPMKQMMLLDLETPAYQARIRRLQELQDQIDHMMTDVYELDKKAQTDHYVNTGADSYYRGIYDVQRQIGFQFAFSHIDQKAFDRLLKSKWSGKNYSDRIWDNTRQVAQSVKDELLLELMTGKKLDDCAEAIQNRFQVGAFESRRLIRTESNFVSGQMQQQAYKECGSDYYEYVATLDSKTDEECGRLDGKRFSVKDAKPGVNMNPMHPFCRCTTIIALDDDIKSGLERRARDPKTGKNIKVPASKNYMDWAKENGLQTLSKKVVQPPQKKNKNNSAAPAAAAVLSSVRRIAKTIAEARDILTKDVGFGKIDSSFQDVDDDLAIAAANQLSKLEERFNAIHKSEGMIFAKNQGRATAFVQASIINPVEQDLSLCPSSFRSKRGLIGNTRSMVKKRWFMPCAETDEEIQIYAVTHEYGHMIHNILIRDEMKAAGWKENDPGAFLNPARYSSTGYYKWYSDIRKKSLRKFQKEIVKIAKSMDPDFDLSDNLSKYGASNHAEFFAEAFANSQLSKPNTLGNAMNEWLKGRGL